MRVLSILLLFCTISVAQTKTGTIDIDFIISQMPELSAVQQDVDAYGKSLEGDLKAKLTAYEKEIATYESQSNTMTINQRQAMQDSIVAMEADINKYRQNASQLITLKRDELLQPLYNKIGDELEKIAAAEGYTQIFQRNNNLIYIDNRFDITLAVLKAMGIEVKEEE